jgi:hypothetical protein
VRRMTDLERCIRDGISLTELRRRREATTKQLVDPAFAAYRLALAKYLAPSNTIHPEGKAE